MNFIYRIVMKLRLRTHMHDESTSFPCGVREVGINGYKLVLNVVSMSSLTRSCISRSNSQWSFRLGTELGFCKNVRTASKRDPLGDGMALKLTVAQVSTSWHSKYKTKLQLTINHLHVTNEIHRFENDVSFL
jgi:hypothetical protein